MDVRITGTIIISALLLGCTGLGSGLRERMTRALTPRTPEQAVTNPFDLYDRECRQLQEQRYTALVLMVRKMDDAFNTARVEKIEYRKQDTLSILYIQLTSKSRYSSSTTDQTQRRSAEIREVILPFMEIARNMLEKDLGHVQAVRVESTYRFRNYLKQNDKLKKESALKDLTAEDLSKL